MTVGVLREGAEEKGLVGGREPRFNPGGSTPGAPTRRLVGSQSWPCVRLR